MVLGPASFCDSADHHGPVRLVRAEVRSLDVDFGDHRIVDVLKIRPEVAGIGQTRAVEFQGHAGDGRAV